ncbi:hypothetical protein CPB86DRAFT_820069 [Serendipita vermifera]|nr:hypothetical protein CPB86DRAFT_820069 [Serendipita vermifera]
MNNSHYITYPECYQGSSRSSNTNPQRYARHDIVIPSGSTNISTPYRRGHSGYVVPPQNLDATVADITKLFFSFHNKIQSCELTTEMSIIRDRFLDNVQELYDLISTLCEASRSVANALRSVTDQYGPRRGTDPASEITAAREATQRALRQLASVAKGLMDRTQELKHTAERPRGAFKTALSCFTNWKIDKGIAYAAPATTIAAGSGSLNDALNHMDSLSHQAQALNVVWKGLVVAAGCLGAVALLKDYCPDAAAYKYSNWTATQKTMGEVYTGIMHLMDILAGVDLYWRKKYRQLAVQDTRNTTTLITLANVLDGQVDDCKRLMSAMVFSSMARDSAEEVPYTILEYERNPGSNRQLYPPQPNVSYPPRIVGRR